MLHTCFLNLTSVVQRMATTLYVMLNTCFLNLTSVVQRMATTLYVQVVGRVKERDLADAGGDLYASMQLMMLHYALVSSFYASMQLMMLHYALAVASTRLCSS